MVSVLRLGRRMISQLPGTIGSYTESRVKTLRSETGRGNSSCTRRVEPSSSASTDFAPVAAADQFPRNELRDRHRLVAERDGRRCSGGRLVYGRGVGDAANSELEINGERQRRYVHGSGDGSDAVERPLLRPDGDALAVENGLERCIVAKDRRLNG